MATRWFPGERLRLLTGLLAIVCVWMMVLPQNAAAHATLLSATPTDGAQLDEAPTEIVLTFSEPVGIVDDATTLIGNDIETIDLIPTANGSDVTIPIDAELPDGDYIVQWRVVSADSHPIFGTVSFTIGEGSGSSFSVDALPAWVDIARVATVSAKYLGLLVGAGLLLMVRLVKRDDLTEAMPRVIPAIAVAIVGALLELPLAAIEQIGKVPSGASAFFDALGQLDSATVMAAAASIVLAGIALIAIRTARPWSFAAVALAGALLAQVLSGHTRSKDPTWLMFVADVVHLSAAALWIGGILLLVLGLTGRWRGTAFVDDRASTGSVSRFSSLAAWISVAVLISGVTMAVTILRSWDAMFETDYGTSLMLKISAVVVVFMLAAGNRFVFIPRLPGAKAMTWLRSLVVAELVILLVVVGVTGRLVQQDPNVVAGPVNGVLYESESSLDDQHTLNLTIVQGNGAEMEMSATILDESGEAVVHEDGIEIAWFHPKKEIGPISFAMAWDPATETYRSSGNIPLSGEWRVTVRAEIDRFTDSRSTVKVVVPD